MCMMKKFRSYKTPVSLLTPIILIFLLSSVAHSQVVQTVEMGANSAPDPNLGPATTVTIPLLHNEGNPDDSIFTPYFPLTEVTISFSNFQFNSEQSYTSGTTGDSPIVEDNILENLLIGWNIFDTPDTPQESFIRPGEQAPLVQTFFDGIPQSLTYLPEAERNLLFTSSPTGIAGEGFDVNANTGAFMVGSFAGLRDLPYRGEVNTEGEIINLENGARYYMGDMTVSFSRPIVDPVLHIFGLGGSWAFLLDPVDAEPRIFIHGATLELEIDEVIVDDNGTPITITDNSISFSKLSGSDAFEVTNSMIRNADNQPDYQDGTSTSVGTGSALVSGDIISIKFEVFARSIVDNANPFTEVLPCFSEFPEVNCIIGANEYGWGGGETFVLNEDNSYVIPEYNIAQDLFMISVSADVQSDEVLLTEGDSYRMITSPIVSEAAADANIGLSYNDFIGQFWTQGVNHPSYDFGGGEPNVWNWPLGVANSWSPVPNLDAPMPVGEAFMMSIFAIDDLNNPGVNNDFPKTLSFTGSEAAPPIIVNDEGGDNGGWLLLGNPFKDPISIEELLGNRISDNLNEVVYIWDRGTGGGQEGFDPGNIDLDNGPGWRYGILSTGTAPTAPDSDGFPILGNITEGVIMPFQGFFIERNTASGDAIVTFDDGVGTLTRDDLTTPGVEGTFYRKELDVPNILVLRVVGEELGDEVRLRFSENGSFERQRNDALELASYNEHFLHFSARKSSNELLTFSNLPIPTEDFELPLVVETTRPGRYKITASDFNLTFNQDLYLIDTELNESVRIDRNLSYTFTINQAAKANPSPEEAMLRGPQKATTEFGDRFLITTQPREMDSTLPDAVALNQNYPNPFNPTTQIRYELPQQENVRLTVYDMAGRQVAMLVNNQTVSAGAHTVTFDASSLSSGVYMYRLQAGNTVLSRKLTVIK